MLKQNLKKISTSPTTNTRQISEIGISEEPSHAELTLQPQFTNEKQYQEAADYLPSKVEYDIENVDEMIK